LDYEGHIVEEEEEEEGNWGKASDSTQEAKTTGSHLRDRGPRIRGQNEKKERKKKRKNVL
jgi:hypothetical protein